MFYPGKLVFHRCSIALCRY